MKKKAGLYFLLLAVIFSCNKKQTLFNKLSSSSTGITFRNDITESDSMNIIDLENIYNGGGVGIADFNNDGLQDIYFTGNMVANKLYLNKGKLKFEDITNIANVQGEEKWSRGVSIVDINNDGWQDIYISCTILNDSAKRENILYINQGLNKEAVPTFKNLAKEYGLNDHSHTTQSAFFDYDNDGDLDVYLAVNVFAKRDNPNIFRKIFTNGEHPNTDRLYRNDWDSANGHPVFTNVSRAAGILQEGFAHSVTVCDINQDGWKDVFVANDYLSENLLYINNRNGTFTNQSKKYFKHTAYNAMGADVVDINNDGLSDVIELDMNPEDNYRKKTMLSGANYQSYIYNNTYGFQYQYIRNNLHLNMGPTGYGNDSLTHPVFSDISFYSTVAETDWSWTPLVADFDNDGYRDIIITNGFPKDVTDHDFMMFRNSTFGMNDKKKLLSLIPEVKISNYAYQNNGSLKFIDVTKEWGVDLPSFSNGAAVADLDNDGDLDVIINNINDEAFLYENNQRVSENNHHHYLQVKPEGDQFNKDAYGAWVKIFYGNNQQQVYETNPVRGYLSSVQNIVHFGLDSINLVDSLIIIWPDNTTQTVYNVKTNQKILIKKSVDAKAFAWGRPATASIFLFKEAGKELDINFTDSQGDFNDYNIQRLLPHKFSETGPALTSGDINGDGLEDFIVGSSAGSSETIFLQQENGKFLQKYLTSDTIGKLSNDVSVLLFDADNDNDLDLYICSGGYESKAMTVAYQDKLYLNDGKGNFTLSNKSLPLNFISKSCVRAADFDKDGDLDLFVGGRVEPGAYPKPVSSTLLRNDTKNGVVKFTDVTNSVATGLKNIGLICDAIWADYDNDGWIDLVLAGEWMPVTFFKNNQGVLINQTGTSGISDKTGWWNCITAADIDQDGKIDFIAGNLGENSFFSSNTTYPINNYYGDFDNNGTVKTITTKFLKDRQDNYKEYVAASRDEAVDQVPSIKKKYLEYKTFADATFHQLFSAESIKKSIQNTANYFSSSIIKNMGNGKFTLIPLPVPAQLSSISAILPGDFNGDGITDLFLTGNDYGMEVFNGRLDAFNGLVLTGDGKGIFYPLSMEKSGVYIPLSSKALTILKSKSHGNLIIVSQHKGPLKIFVQKK